MKFFLPKYELFNLFCENIKFINKHTNSSSSNSRSQSAESSESPASSGDRSHASVITTERRCIQVNKSDELTSNSPRRYKNYFEVLQSVIETNPIVKEKHQNPQLHKKESHQNHKSHNQIQTIMERQIDKENRKVTKQNRILSSKNTLGANNKYKQKHSRYSPNQQSDSSTHKKHSNNQLSSVRSQTRLQQPNFTGQDLNMPHNQQQISGNAGSQTQRPSSRNMNMPQNYTSKHQRQQLLPQQNTESTTQNLKWVTFSKRLKEEEGIQTKIILSTTKNFNIKSESQTLMNSTRIVWMRKMTVPHLTNMKKRTKIIDGMFASSTNEDPFVTGKFCDNTGYAKQFLFKYSNNNSKNSTMRFN